MLSVALCWRWPYEAAIFILTCAGTLRIGEVLQAHRSDLILPSDAAPGQSFIPSQIADPKTRGRSARHQSARVDQPDIIQLLSAAYGKADLDDMLVAALTEYIEEEEVFSAFSSLRYHWHQWS